MSKKILIIDDEPNIQKVLVTRLEMNGFQAISAADPIEGFKKITEETPDLILLDVMMPEMTGYEFLNFMKENAKHYMSIPVIVMSARQSMEDHFNSWDIFKFIPKPFEHEVLLKAINEALGLSKPEAKKKISIPAPVEEVKKNVVSEPENPAAEGKVLFLSMDYGLIEKIHEFFKEKKYEVKVRDDVKEAVELAQAWRPDLLLIHFSESTMSLDFNYVLNQFKQDPNIQLTKVMAICQEALIIDARKELKNIQVVNYINVTNLQHKLEKFLNVDLI